jgi:DNA polymerase
MLQAALFEKNDLTEGNGRALADIRARALACTSCKLHSTRKSVVFGEGNPHEPLVAFVGEGPGATEDETSKPFQGRAGELLNKMIARMGLKREALYICNVVCCRPPENRTPELDEVVACQPYLFNQLRLVRPKVIITLGATATQTLLKKVKPLMELRGKWHKWESIPVRPTFHPAYLLRNPKERATTSMDLDAVLNLLKEEVRVKS